MALEEFVGAIVLEVDGKEVDVVDLTATTKTGRKLVKTMNRTGKPRGYAKGVADYDLSITVVIPQSGDLDWLAVEGAKITIFPVSEGGKRTTYSDCIVLEKSEKYSVDNEARRDLKVAAMDEVIE